MNVAVLGAGTMGAGIAQVALQYGHAVTLYDVAESMHGRAKSGIEAGLARLVEKGRLDATARDAALANLGITGTLSDVTGADLVIEAAPEAMSIKQDLFRFLDEFCRPDAVLATNTSSLSVTAIAAMTRRPERVVGLHFFNPAPLMALVEVIAADQSDPRALAVAHDFALSLGKTPVRCKDTPGFIVNRVARPFYGEALKILGEGGADATTIDTAMKAAGFRMGPFELMDLIGIDVNFAVTQSVYQAFFGEPRFRPHPIQRRMVDAGRLGRKSGRGFYAYDAKETPSPVALTAPAPEARGQRYVVVGGPPHIAAWGEAVTAAGHDVVLIDVTHSFPAADLLPSLDEVAGIFEVGPGLPAARQRWQRQVAAHANAETWLVTTDLTRTATAAMADHGLRTAVFADWAGAAAPGELALAEQLGEPAGQAVVAGIGAVGKHTLRVPDYVGGVFARIVSMIANEAAFALQEGVAEAVEIDRALRLGANYPRGPLAWADELGAQRVVDLLDALRATTGEERYRVAPLLRQRAIAERPLAATAPEVSAARA